MAKPITPADLEAAEIERMKAIQESIDGRAEMWLQSARIGWNKSQQMMYHGLRNLVEDDMRAFDMVIGGGEITLDQQKKLEAMEEKKQVTEEKRQEYFDTVVELSKERDKIMLENSDFGFGTRLTNGIIESFTNPVTLGANIAVGVATGGAGVVAGGIALGANATLDVATAEYESQIYQGRSLSTEEKLGVAGTSLALAGLFAAGGYAFRRWRATPDIKPDTTILERGAQHGDRTLYDGATRQRLFSDYPGARNKFVIDPYDAATKNRIRESGMKMSDIDNAISSIDTDGSIRRMAWELSADQPTTLQRDFSYYEFLELNSPVKPDKATSLNYAAHKLQRNTYLDDITETILPTVKDYAERYYSTQAGKPTKVKVPLNAQQIEDTILSLNRRYQSQLTFVRNEYTNLLGVKPKEYIKLKGAQNKDIATAWIRNDFSTFGEQEQNFFRAVGDDYRLQTTMSTKIDLMGDSPLINIVDKNSDIVTPTGEVKLGVEFLDRLQSKSLKGDEKRLLIELAQNNEKQLTEFLTDIDVYKNTGKLNKKYFKGKTKKKIDRLLEENKDFIEGLTDQYVRGADISIRNFEEARPIRYRKRDYSEDSIKVNQTYNKQKLMMDYSEYYNQKFGTNIDDLTEEQLNNVFKPEKLGELIERIDPYFEKGLFPEGAWSDTQKARMFYEVLSEVADTRASARLTGQYKTMGEISWLFKDRASWKEFFTDPRYLKTNSEMIRDIFNNQAGDTAMIMTYGTNNPYRIKYDIAREFDRALSKSLGKTLDAAEMFVSRKSKEIFNRMIDNTLLGKLERATTTAQILSERSRNIIRRGVMSFTGTSELGVSNYALMISRASKYKGVGVVTQPFQDGYWGIVRAIKKSGGADVGIPTRKYAISQAMKDYDIKKSLIDPDLIDEVGILGKVNAYGQEGVRMYDDVAMSIQQLSSRQLQKYGEAFTVKEIHSLPTRLDKFDKLDPDLKKLLDVSGIKKENYLDFLAFSKNHIEKNGLYIDVDKLASIRNDARTLNLDITNEERLLNLYYNMSDDVGNPMSKTPLHTKMQDELTQWLGMFRSFSRNMNKDMLDRIMYITNSEGISKSRLSMEGLKRTPRDAVIGLSIVPTLAVGGFGYTVIKELVRANRTMDQRMAVVQTHFERVVDAFEGLTLGELNNFSSTMLDYASNNIDFVNMLSADSPLLSTVNKIKKIYKTFNDEEKKLFGTNIEEGTAELTEFMFTTFISRAIWNNFQADPERPIKVYGAGKDFNLQAEYNKQLGAPFLRSQKDQFIRDREDNKVMGDYLIDSTESFEKLPEDKKEYFKRIMDYKRVPQAEREIHKPEYAVAFNRASKEDLPVILNELYEIQDKQDFDGFVNDTANREIDTNFKAMDKNKQLFAGLIAGAMGITEPGEIQQFKKKYYNTMRTAKKDQLSKIIKKEFGIEYDQFKKMYADPKKANETLRSYEKLFDTMQE